MVCGLWFVVCGLGVVVCGLRFVVCGLSVICFRLLFDALASKGEQEGVVDAVIVGRLLLRSSCIAFFY